MTSDDMVRCVAFEIGLFEEDITPEIREVIETAPDFEHFESLVEYVKSSIGFGEKL